LDDVERRTFLVQPARKGPLPGPVELLDVELDERTGIMVLLPWRGLFAGAQADNHIPDPRCLAGLERHLAGSAVPLVEQADHRDALRHRRGAERRIRTGRHIDRHHIGRRLVLV
jgi:hypothetical protein